MNNSPNQNNNYLKKLINALPSALLVVDRQLKIWDTNPAALELFGSQFELQLKDLCGTIINCLHALESERGCGTTEHCADCVIRTAVKAVFKGQAYYKEKCQLKIKKDGEVSDFFMLVTSSLIDYEDNELVLLVLEDITEITILKRILPICANCKTIRNDDNYWEAVSDYLRKHTDLEFTHSICPECAADLYNDLELKL